MLPYSCTLGGFQWEVVAGIKRGKEAVGSREVEAESYVFHGRITTVPAALLATRRW